MTHLVMARIKASGIKERNDVLDLLKELESKIYKSTGSDHAVKYEDDTIAPYYEHDKRKTTRGIVGYNIHRKCDNIIDREFKCDDDKDIIITGDNHDCPSEGDEVWFKLINSVVKSKFPHLSVEKYIMTGYYKFIPYE